ncbi:Uncharacterised protein [Mycobacteroides abscessus subsp. abscessus]|nr:Uncharacterised protein [Mycobacteroides abscessus subsp. abscessus]
MAGGVHRNQLGHRVDAQVGAREFGDVRQLGFQHVRTEMTHVNVDVVLVRPGAAAFEHFENH